jgi:hypothetical protein
MHLDLLQKRRLGKRSLKFGDTAQANAPVGVFVPAARPPIERDQGQLATGLRDCIKMRLSSFSQIDMRGFPTAIG